VHASRYIHLPMWLKTETRVEARRNELQNERRLHHASLGQQKALPKGIDGTLEDVSDMNIVEKIS